MLSEIEKAVLDCHIEQQVCDTCIFKNECGTDSFKDTLVEALKSLTSSVLSALR